LEVQITLHFKPLCCVDFVGSWYAICEWAETWSTTELCTDVAKVGVYNDFLSYLFSGNRLFHCCFALDTTEIKLIPKTCFVSANCQRNRLVSAPYVSETMRTMLKQIWCNCPIDQTYLYWTKRIDCVIDIWQLHVMCLYFSGCK